MLFSILFLFFYVWPPDPTTITTAGTHARKQTYTSTDTHTQARTAYIHTCASTEAEHYSVIQPSLSHLHLPSQRVPLPSHASQSDNVDAWAQYWFLTASTPPPASLCSRCRCRRRLRPRHRKCMHRASIRGVVWRSVVALPVVARVAFALFLSLLFFFYLLHVCVLVVVFLSAPRRRRRRLSKRK